MNCQAWVDPLKFNKKGEPTARAVLAPYNGSLEFALTHAKSEKQKTKLREAWKRAVHCGGHVLFSTWAESDEDGFPDGVNAELRCVQCREYIHHVGMNSEIVGQWIQERLDAMP